VAQRVSQHVEQLLKEKLTDGTRIVSFPKSHVAFELHHQPCAAANPRLPILSLTHTFREDALHAVLERRAPLTMLRLALLLLLLLRTSSDASSFCT
jgi:hypothetical protein